MSASDELAKSLLEEIFFFYNYLHQPKSECMSLPIYERKWIINKFIEEKEKENAAMESAKRKAKNSR